MTDFSVMGTSSVCPQCQTPGASGLESDMRKIRCPKCGLRRDREGADVIPFLRPVPDEGSVTLTLNRYQRDNLLWLLNLIWECYLREGVNTGDWVGEIPQLLSPETGGRITSRHRPNVGMEEWIKQYCPDALADYQKWRENLEERFESK